MSLYKMLGVLILMVLCLFESLSGCVFAPGMDLKESLRSNAVKIEGIDEPIEIQTITQDLIKSIYDGENENASVSLPEILVDEIKSIDKEYRIGVNDILTIVVWGLPEFVGQGVASDQSPLLSRQVRADGSIFFPYAGVMKVAEKTRESVRLEVTKRLSKFFKNPQVDVSVSKFQSKNVVLTGAFSNPGLQPITSVPLTLNQALGAAGGPIDEGDLSDLRLIREGEEYKINYLELSKSSLDVHHIYLKDKDIIHLPLSHSNKAYVLGEVVRPQAIPLSAGRMTLTDALGAAGGINQSLGSGNEVYILRGVAAWNKVNNNYINNLPEIFKLDAKSPASFLLASNFSIHKQDVIFVGPAELTKWNRVIAQLFPFARFLDAVDDLSEN